MTGRRFTMALALVLFAVPAHAESWSIGSNLGISILGPRNGGDALLEFAAPGGAGLSVPSFQPGLRFGVPVGNGDNETYFDTGLLVVSGSGSTFTGYQITANLQHNFSSKSSANPYLTIGGGVMGESSSDGNSQSNPILGGGLGVRHRVPGDHGAVRIEFRYDHIFEDKQGFAGGSLIGVLFGFDLWMK